MALFTHRKSTARGDDSGEEPPLQLPQTIGSILRASRLQSGKSIADAAAALRIRAAFLTAIEEDELGQLPGPVYAVGFVRTYADYLGLDGEKVAQRFKQDIAGLESRQDFSFPVALPERSRPGGAIFLVALIVAACAYGLWYYRASGERAHPERVAAVPADLMPPQPIAAPKSGAPTPAPSAPAASSTPASASAPIAEPAAPAAPSAATNPPQAETAAASTTAIVASPAAAAPPAHGAAAPTEQASPPAEAPSASPQATQATTEAAQPSSEAAAPPPPPPEATRVAAIPAVPEGAPKPDAPRVYGVTNGPVRIVLRAAGGDSWIQVKDGSQTIAMRVLRKGESYRVPDRKGLILVTGSAGALEITVDGHPVPSVGPLGRKRIVALDPEKLEKGAATLD